MEKTLPARLHPWLRLYPVGLPLIWLWFVLIDDLRVEWTVNPQYNYGWAVPFLCAYLLWRKIQAPEIKSRKSEAGSQTSGIGPLIFIFCVLAFLYAPTRLIQEANPGWRLVSWALALEVVGITLIFIRLLICVTTFPNDCAAGQIKTSSPSHRLRFSDFIFPVCFFLVAVPWPSFFEMSLIQWLTHLDTAATTELLGWLGIPAMTHGNVIEVATGVVGVDEACSGIRSFQATLMISLFLGEWHKLAVRRRGLLVFCGFALSLLFNLARLSVLVTVAARKGVAAIATWHDPAGVTILVACFISLWMLGIWLGRRQASKISEPEIILAPTFNAQFANAKTMAIGLCFWIAAVEISVEGWYRWHEARLPATTPWTVAWPVNETGFKEIALSPSALQILRYDEGRSAAWVADGIGWQAVFLRWNRGRTALHLAQNHTPQVCLTAAGHTLTTISEATWFEAGDLNLPFNIYTLTDTPKPFFVFYCLWDDRASAQGRGTLSLTFGNRLTPVLQGLRNPGQRSLEIALAGDLDAAQAKAILQNQLGRLIRSETSGPAAETK